MFRSIHDQKDSKIDKNVSLAYLEELGLLKSYKFPFLFLTDSRNYNKIFKDSEFVKSVYKKIKTENTNPVRGLYNLYRDYLPRSIVSYSPKNNISDISRLYRLSKKGVNMFCKLELDSIIDDAKSNWFSYDDESLNFLMNVDNLEILQEEKINVKNGKIYFQDKLPYIMLPNKDYKSIVAKVIVNKEVSMKIQFSLMVKPDYIFKKVISKLEMIRPELVFNPMRKILKVNNLW